MFKRHLLSSAAYFAPRDEGAGGTPEDERIPGDLSDDDETPTDPIDDPAEDDTGGGANDDQDAEDDDTHGEDDDADGGAEAGARQPSRGERQYAELRRQRREDAAAIATLTRQLDEMRRNPPQPQQPTETAAQRAERLALMSPEERIAETVNSALAVHEHKTAQLTNHLLDQSDRSSFQARCAANPVFQKIANEVEQRLAGFRQRGEASVPREVIATYIIGERAIAQMGKAKPGAQQRRQQQTSRPTNGRGDIAPNRSQRRSGNTVEDFERRHGDDII